MGRGSGQYSAELESSSESASVARNSDSCEPVSAVGSSRCSSACLAMRQCGGPAPGMSPSGDPGPGTRPGSGPDAGPLLEVAPAAPGTQAARSSRESRRGGPILQDRQPRHIPGPPASAALAASCAGDSPALTARPSPLDRCGGLRRYSCGRDRVPPGGTGSQLFSVHHLSSKFASTRPVIVLFVDHNTSAVLAQDRTS